MAYNWGKINTILFPVSLPVCLLVCCSLSRHVCLLGCLRVCPVSIYLSAVVCTFVCLSVSHLSVCLSVSLSVFLLSICMSFLLSVCLSVCLPFSPVYLSVTCPVSPSLFNLGWRVSLGLQSFADNNPLCPANFHKELTRILHTPPPPLVLQAHCNTTFLGWLQQQLHWLQVDLCRLVFNAQYAPWMLIAKKNFFFVGWF